MSEWRSVSRLVPTIERAYVVVHPLQCQLLVLQAKVHAWVLLEHLLDGEKA